MFCWQWQFNMCQSKLAKWLLLVVVGCCWLLLSCCHVLFYRRGSNSTAELFSFRNGVLQPGKLADQASRQKISGEELQQELATVEFVTHDLVANLPQGMTGNFALVEWLGLYVAGESTDRDLVMGLGYNRWLTHQQVSQAVAQHLQQLHQEHFATAKPISRRSAISWVYGIILQKMLKVCFDEDTQFYCLKGINWSTGHYLMHKETMEEKPEMMLTS